MQCHADYQNALHWCWIDCKQFKIRKQIATLRSFQLLRCISMISELFACFRPPKRLESETDDELGVPEKRPRVKIASRTPHVEFKQQQTEGKIIKTVANTSYSSTFASPDKSYLIGSATTCIHVRSKLIIKI